MKDRDTDAQYDLKTDPSAYGRREVCRMGLGALGVAALWGAGGRPALSASFSDEDLIYLSAEELLPLFRSRKLSPVELLKVQIARLEATNDRVNCITHTYFDTAMEAARESEQRWMNGTARALEGITCGIKDEHHDAGWTVTMGSAMHKDQKMAEADDIVVKLKEAGAVLPFQTTVPELYVHGLTFSRLWGVTRNPWNLEYGVGGSSGGSGAALAAGMCTIATGSDMGGSVRLPSAFNGLYGFKPPFGRVSTVLPLSPFSGTGPMARSFTGMAMMQNVIAGQTPHAPATMPKVEMPLDYPGIEGMRIAYAPDLNYVRIDQETRDGMAAAAQRLRELGAEVVEIDLDMGVSFEELTAQFSKMVLSGAMGGWLKNYLPQRDQMTPYAAWFVSKLEKEQYDATDQAEFGAFMKAFYARISDQVWNDGFDALVCATLNTSHVPADFDHSVSSFELDGETLPTLFIGSLTAPWNVLNWCPVMAVPAGLTARNMPIGMQIVGAPYQDHTVFRISHAYEGASPRLFAGDRMPDFRKG